MSIVSAVWKPVGFFKDVDWFFWFYVEFLGYCFHQSISLIFSSGRFGFLKHWGILWQISAAHISDGWRFCVAMSSLRFSNLRLLNFCAVCEYPIWQYYFWSGFVILLTSLGWWSRTCSCVCGLPINYLQLQEMKFIIRVCSASRRHLIMKNDWS